MELVTDNASPTLPKVAATQRKSAWSEDEQAALAHSHAMLGNRWAAISKQMPGRSENDIKNFWHATLRSKGVRRSRFLFTYVCLVRDHCAEAATRRSALQQAREVCGGGGGAGGRGAGQQQRPSNRTVGRTISFSGAVPQSPSSDGAAASGPSAAAAAAAVRRSISVSGAAAFAAAKSSYHAPAAAAATVTSPPLPLPQHASGTATPSAAYGAYGEPSPLSTTSQGNSPSGYQQQQLQQQLNHQHQQYQEQQLMPAHASWPTPRTDLSELRVLAVGAQGAMQTRWADNNPSANCHGGSSFASDGTTSVQHSEPYGSSLPYSADCLTRVSSVNLPQEQQQQQQQQQLAQQQQQQQQQSHVQGLPSPGAWPLAAAGGAFPDARALPRNAHSQPQPFVAGSERLLGGLAQGGGGDGGGVGCGALYGSCPPQRTSDYGGSTSSGMGGGQLDGRPSYDGTANRSPYKRYVDMPIPQAIAAAAAAAGGGGGGDGSTVVRLPTRTLAAPMTRYDTTDLAATAGPVSASAGPDSSGGLLPPARPSAPLSMAPGVAPRPAAAAAAATHGGRGAAVTALGSPGSATAGGMPFDARSTRHHQQQRQQQQQQKQVSAFGEELMFAGCGQPTPSQLQQHMQQQHMQQQQRQYTTGDGYYEHHNQQQQQHQQQQQQDGDGAVSCHMVSPFSASSPLSEGGFGAGRATASGVVHVQQAYDQQQHLQHHHHQQQSHMTRQLSAPVGCGVGVRLDWRPLVGGPQSGGGGGGPHAAERLQRLLQQQRNWPVTDAATTMGLDTELLHELQLGPVQQQQQQVPLMRQAWAGQGPGL